MYVAVLAPRILRGLCRVLDKLCSLQVTGAKYKILASCGLVLGVRLDIVLVSLYFMSQSIPEISIFSHAFVFF